MRLYALQKKILGVEARKFDYSKTEGQVEALQGVDTLILVSSNEIGQRFCTTQQRN